MRQDSDGVVIIEGGGQFSDGDPLVGMYVELDMNKMQVFVSTTESVKIFADGEGRPETLADEYLDMAFPIALSEAVDGSILSDLEGNQSSSKLSPFVHEGGSSLMVFDTGSTATGAVQLTFPDDAKAIIVQLKANSLEVIVHDHDEETFSSSGIINFENPALEQYNAMDGLREHIDPGLQQKL